MAEPGKTSKRTFMPGDGKEVAYLILVFFGLPIIALIVTVAGGLLESRPDVAGLSSSTGDIDQPGVRPGPGPTTTSTSQPATSPAASTWKPPRFKAQQEQRDKMVRVIKGYGLTDKAVLAAMKAVPRHEFVPARIRHKAHRDSPLPIGYGQTISQPYIVAEMTRQLKLKANSRVLEVGTGSGYQAAVLSEFTPHVYSIEIIKALADPAANRLKRLGYDVVRVRHADGYYGWPEGGQFDGIIVTCAAGQIPPPLIEQLTPGGRMVIPVGPVFGTQSLMLLEKDKEGRVRSRSLMYVRFVPLVREDAKDR